MGPRPTTPEEGPAGAESPSADPSTVPDGSAPTASGPDGSAVAATSLALPGARQLISVGLDLCLRANASLRVASMAIGSQILGAVGPLVVLLIVVAGRAPDILAELIDANGSVSGQAQAVTGSLFVTGIVGGWALAVLAIESRIVAVALLGGQAIGRPVSPLEALRRSRQVFWGVAAATFVIQLVLNLTVSVITLPLAASEATSVFGTAVAALLSVPFVYLVSGIALGAASPLEAIRRSVAMARTRWRLALVVAIAETLAQTLLVLALLAGLDILSRISDVLGLGFDSGGPTTFLTIVVALLATAAAGSLLFMVTAIAAAPRVVAFVGLTRYGAGLDRARDGAPGARHVRWLSLPMGTGIVLAVLAAFAGIAAAGQAA